MRRMLSRLHTSTKHRCYSSQQQRAAPARLFATLASASGVMGGTLEDLKFDNQTLRSLAVDESRDGSTRTVRGANFSLVRATPRAAGPANHIHTAWAPAPAHG